MSSRPLTILNLNGKNLKDSDNIFVELLNLEDLIELDLSNNQLTRIPDDLSSLNKLTVIDLTNNPFQNFERIATSLSTLPSLLDLRINISDQNEAIAILTNLPNLQFLNGKSTKEEGTGLDIEDRDIDQFSLNNEIENFNGVFNRINERLKNLNSQASKHFFEEFHSRLTGEVQKINGAVDNTVPNYIYAANLLKAKISIYSFFHTKAVSVIERRDPETGAILMDTMNYIKESQEAMYDLLSKLNVKIEDKIENYRRQTEEAIRAANSNPKLSQVEQLEKQLEQALKHNEFLTKQSQDEQSLLLDKIERLEMENKNMTEKIIKKAKDLSSDEYTREFNVNKSNLVMNRSSVNIGASAVDLNNSKLLINKSFNGNNALIGPVGSRVLTKKMLLEIIEEIYTSKEHFDRKCLESKMPRETMEQHMYSYLNQKYGLKNLIIEWATSIINGIRMFSPEDSEICLFGKILRNEIEEETRVVLQKMKSTFAELLVYFLKAKHPLKSNAEIKEIALSKQSGLLNEDEWKGIIYYLHDKNEGVIIENKIIEFIKKRYIDKPTGKVETGNKKLTREEIQNLSKAKEDYRILYTDFVKIVLDSQIRTRDKYLRNFVYLFKTVDTDSNGILNEDEFINLLAMMNIYSEKYFDENANRLLNQSDPFNNKQITFSECVTLFSNEILMDSDEQGNKVKLSLLDKVNLNDEILK